MPLTSGFRSPCVPLTSSPAALLAARAPIAPEQARFTPARDYFLIGTRDRPRPFTPAGRQVGEDSAALGRFNADERPGRND